MGRGRLNPLGIRRVKDINAPSLSDNKPTICEGNLTLKERYGALSNLPTNKAPGNDDLSRELYVVFFDLVGNDVLASLNYSYQLGELSNSQRQAIMTLVEKKRNDKKINQELEKIFYLPQNVMLSTCLTFDNSVHLLILVSVELPLYNCHSIVECYKLFSGVRLSITHNTSGFLLTVGIEKAFDSLDHQLLIVALKKYAFGLPLFCGSSVIAA